MYQVLPLLVILYTTAAHRYRGEHVESKNISPPIVTTPMGQIRGSTMNSRLGKTIYTFRGIKYAQSPVGDLRFKPPVSVERYDKIYNATDDCAACPQPTDDPTSEDCLCLNVYTTKLPEGDNNNVRRPVIVFIHPIGFYGGGSPSYWIGPQYYTDQDIVLVTFNYRLATLGFLATGDKESPGNNGMKDQVLLLKWVQKNIAAFGGDPNSVTIQGSSAGAISVVLHMLSPMSKGLFHKAIAMSDGWAQWPITYHQMDYAKKQARFVGCPDDTSENIVKCLKTKTASEIANTLSQFNEFGWDPVLKFTPVIEKDFGQERFLTDHPIKLLMNGDFQNVPLISGITAEEFSWFMFNVIDNATLLKDMNEKWEEIAPISFLYEREGEESQKISRGLREFYFNNKPIGRSNMKKLGELYADSAVGFGVNRCVKLISEKNTAPTYYYKFSYQGRYSHFYLPGSNNTVPYGVVHHDDLIYLFTIPRVFPIFNATGPKEIEMVEKLTTLYATFAKYGNPTPNDKLDNVKWETFDMETQKYLDIGNTLAMQEKLYDNRYREWEKLFPLEIYKSL